MDLTSPLRLPAKLESAVQRIRMAARTAAEHTIDSLGLAALATHQVRQRDALLGAQYELNRKLAIFALTFNEALDTDVARQTGGLTPSVGPSLSAEALVSSWDKLTLVEDHEVEIHISADRFALEISHACEWEIRELDAYMGTLLGLGAAEHDRNPLRAEVIGQAMIRAVESVCDRPEVRKVLSTEIARSLAHAMRQTYAEVVADLRQSGLRPAGLAVRHTPVRGTSMHGAFGAGGGGSEFERGRAQPAMPGRRPSGHDGPGQVSHNSHTSQISHGASLGRVEGEMMNLIRRLASQPGLSPGGGQAWSSSAGYPGLAADGYADEDDRCGHDQPPSLPGSAARLMARLAAPNLILAHRDELRQAASGGLDHMVIDVIAGLFDQILSDSKVPPQVARQIARLQLPVLRAALGDKSFFSSRRHPVRRFINRIASLGTAVDGFDDAEGQALLARVADLVQEIVDGDFEQIAVYEDKLAALQTFIFEQSRQRVQALGQADQLLADKEASLQVQQRYGQALQEALQGLPVPAYLHEFLAQTWSRAIAQAALAEGNDAALTQRLREAGRELVLSVQAKGSPERRQQFLRKLPQLMKDLNLGLDRIACPQADRQQFFAHLLPAHAKSLTGQAQSVLEHNLLARRLDSALALAVPEARDLPPLQAGPAQQALQSAASASDFSPAEAAAVGLLDDTAVDWQAALDIDLAAEPELGVADLNIAGLPPPEAIEPTRGKSLADHVQLGYAYRLQLQGQWQKVRLSHVSAGRSFFVFTTGHKHQETISMTSRMVARMCETGRMRAVESSYLMERATHRARKQLAALKAPSKV